MNNQDDYYTIPILNIGTRKNKPTSPIAGKGFNRLLKILNFAIGRVTDPKTVHKNWRTRAERQTIDLTTISQM